MYIADSTFRNSSIAVKLKSMYSNASCIQLHMGGVLINDTGKKDSEYALHICNTYSIALNNITLLNNYPPSGGLCICSVHKAILMNVNFWNSYPPVLSLYKVKEVIFKGVLSFKHNVGPGYGVTIISVEDFMMDESFKPTVTEFSDNHIEEDVFKIGPSTLVWITFTTVTFVNNTSTQGGILVMDEVYFKSSYSSVSFQNNSALLSKTRGGIMLLKQTKADLDFDSKMLFIHNRALLSGGITLLDSGIPLEDSTMSFEYNEGGNGGAIAFYDGSFIMKSRAGHNKIILRFYNNHAVRGGGIFVKDTDYINSLTHIQEEYFIHRPTIRTSLAESNHSRYAIIFHLSNNTATLSGNDVYGGWIDSDFMNYWGIILSEGYGKGDHHNAIASDPT